MMLINKDLIESDAGVVQIIVVGQDFYQIFICIMNTKNFITY